ncbi:Na(+)/H(+) exchange regulatory cofactor NHE-RF2 [Trachymyrmex septentrionalis]|uniref:Na(+)/H(+) exchange regulatory cofactor NHE-RF2 n=1 Tax=Trachymyrmex septentrionalis TaxID=34720 RepID=A0A195FH36_9HYME|nr:Na(+)/H(+) exchange regulatory cofactor NHE-RF2 [Trachymyrmex septentrionalis]
MSSFKDDKVPCARLCHIVKWDDFNGYGFNLHAQKGKNGQFIGKVDEGSPSLAAGLRQGDRIVEVNEIDIANETHNQVVERIKAFANETKLLVVDQEADDYFRENNIVIKGTMSNIKVIKTPERNPNSVEDRSEGSNCSVDEGRNRFYRDLYCRNHGDRKHKHRVACIFYLDHQVELMTRQEAI